MTDARQRLLNPPVYPTVLPPSSLLPALQADLMGPGKHINMAHPGRTKTLLEALSPQDAQRLTAGAHLYQHQSALGRHGDCDHVADQLGVDRDVARRVHMGFEVDAVCEALQQRVPPREIPEITRRDEIDAAFTAHGFPEE